MTSPLDQAGLEAWGRRVGESAAHGPARSIPLVLALRGPLGAGKSVLARAVARGAGVTGSMPSPTYNLLFRYAGRAGLEVFHLDLYRLEHPDDVWELGWDDVVGGQGLVLIEWPERAGALLPADRWDVRLEFAGETRRAVQLEGVGQAPAIPGPDDARAAESP